MASHNPYIKQPTELILPPICTSIGRSTRRFLRRAASEAAKRLFERRMGCEGCGPGGVSPVEFLRGKAILF